MKSLERLPGTYSVCKLRYLTRVDIMLLLAEPFYAVSKSPEETTLLCSRRIVEAVEERVEERVDNLKAIRFSEKANQDKKYILPDVIAILANDDIGVHAQSAFGTDYILIKESDVEKAESALTSAQYQISDLPRIAQEVA